MDEESIGARLKKRRKALKLRMEDIAKACGVTSEALYMLERDPNRGLNASTLVPMAAILKVNEHWLETGIGSKERPSADDSKVLDKYRKLTDENRALIRDMIDRLLPAGNNHK